MNLTMLSLEGDKPHIKNVRPVNIESYHVVELFMNSLSRIDLDGSNKLVIYFKTLPVGESKYMRDEDFNVSWYYVGEEVLSVFKEINSAEKDVFYLNIIKESLKEIARINNKSNEILDKIELAAEQVVINGFEIYQHVKRLSRHSSTNNCKIDVFRHICPKGEMWYVEITDKMQQQKKKAKIMQDYSHISKVDFFKKSRWNGDLFELLNRFDRVVVTVDIKDYF